MDIQRWRTWKKRNPDFPLTVACNGQWGKKIRGRRYYFGHLADPDAAAARYLEEREYLASGIDPPSWLATGEQSLVMILDAHIEYFQTLVATGERSKHSLEDYLFARRAVVSHAIGNRRADSLTPLDWLGLRKSIMARDWSSRTQRNVIMSIRSSMKWAQRMELCDPARFGVGFDSPKVKNGQNHERLFTAEQVREVLEKSDPLLKVAILFGINCGFYSSDSLTITLDHIHLNGDVPYHDYPRHKTGEYRKAVLWPETVAAIGDYLIVRDAREKNEKKLLLNRLGQPFRGQSINSALIRRFNAVLPSHLAGVSIGSLRHTFATIIGKSNDEESKSVVMGHVHHSLQARVYQQGLIHEMERLAAISQIVHEWLFDAP